MLHLYFACRRWDEDGPWGTPEPPNAQYGGHLRAELAVAQMEVGNLGKLASSLGTCGLCGESVVMYTEQPNKEAAVALTFGVEEVGAAEPSEQ